MKHFLFILIILCMISQNTTADVIDSNHVKAGKFIYVQISIIPENNYSIELGILMEDSVMSPDITNKSLFIESILSHSYYVPLIGIGTAYADVYKKIFGDYNLHKIQTFEAEFNYNTYKYSKEFHFKLQTGDDVYIRFSSITGFFYMHWTMYKESQGQIIGYLKPQWYHFAKEYSKKALPLYNE